MDELKIPDLTAWAERLRTQVSGIAQGDSDHHEFNGPLKEDVLNAIDLLLERAADDSSDATSKESTAPYGQRAVSVFPQSVFEDDANPTEMSATPVPDGGHENSDSGARWAEMQESIQDLKTVFEQRLTHQDECLERLFAAMANAANEPPLPQEGRSEAGAVQERMEELQSVLAESQDRILTLEATQTELRQRNCELADANDALQAEIDEQKQTNESGADLSSLLKQCDATEVDELREALEQARQEITSLQDENQRLSDASAASESSGGQGQVEWQNLTWEEQKQRMLAEEDVDSDQRQQIDELVTVTQLQISARDRKIEDLQRRLEEAEATAAELPPEFDTDELLKLERIKLKEIQTEWEDKVRQAEVDLSAERAKLARERRELESGLSQVRDAAEQEQPSGKRRRWLDHLGLGDDKQK